MTASDDTPLYLFLMRHAKHDDGHLTESGAAHIHSLTMRLTEWIQAEWRDQAKRTICLWLASNSTEVQETADLLAHDVLARIKRPQEQAEQYPFTAFDFPEYGGERPGQARQAWMPVLIPRTVALETDLTAYSPDEGALKRLFHWLEGIDDAARAGEAKARRAETDAPLLVGNDPLIGWVASRLTRRPTPVARGELICLVRQPSAGKRWRLLWTLSEDGEAEAEAVRTKIKSKMNTAAALGTVIVGLTTFVLQNSLPKEPTVWQWLACAALAASAGLYFATLFLYDTLQMPPRFWSSRFPSRLRGKGQPEEIWARLRQGHPSVARPPTSTARVLQASMVRIWVWIFTPATVLAGAGVSCLALSAAGHSGRVSLHPWQVLAAIVVLAAVVGTWVAWQRPNIGASD